MSGNDASSSEVGDSREYLEQWSKSVADAVEIEELRSLIAEYRSIGRNKNLLDDDRSIARKRAHWLSRHLPKTGE